MTFEEIKKVIVDNNLQEAFFYTEEYVKDEDGEFYEKLANKDIGDNREEIDQYLENLGFKNFENVYFVCNTDDVQSVIHFKDWDIYISLTGWYDSYGGFDHDVHDEITQVFPKPTEIIVYE